MTTVIALGGNALVKPGQRGTAAEQRENLRAHLGALRPVLEEPAVITHGNGPQVGAGLLRSERAADEVPPLPLWVTVGQTQAEIGGLISLELEPLIERDVACIVTHVRVDPEDRAFGDPTKPIGPFYSQEEAQTLERERGWKLVEDAGRGWRRVVPSPRPLEVVELDSIQTLLGAGSTVVACGGGGIPVVARGGRLDGIDAVIDKDYVSALIAGALGAERLVILTDVPALYRNFRTPEQKELRTLTPDDAEALLPELPEGSMRPKIKASLEFVRVTGGEALITSAEALGAAIRGESGSRIAR